MPYHCSLIPYAYVHYKHMYVYIRVRIVRYAASLPCYLRAHRRVTFSKYSYLLYADVENHVMLTVKVNRQFWSRFVKSVGDRP